MKARKNTNAPRVILAEVVGEEISDFRSEVSEKKVGAVVAETKRLAGEATAAARRACGHALAAGLRLVWLHKMLEVDPRGGRPAKTVPRGTVSDFRSALEEIGIPKTTAYRWMNAVQVGAGAAGLLQPGEDFVGELPEAGSPRWEMWEEGLAKLAEGMSLNRLALGSCRTATDFARQDDLLFAEEMGHRRAIELLEAVEMGRYTLAQAVKALGSQEAYDKLRSEGAEKVRKDPLYLDMDGRTKELKGLIPKCLVTLRNGFERWDELPEAARRRLRGEWQKVVEVLPEELV